MNRRSFLKSCVGGLGAMLAAPLALRAACEARPQTKRLGDKSLTWKEVMEPYVDHRLDGAMRRYAEEKLAFDDCLLDIPHRDPKL